MENIFFGEWVEYLDEEEKKEAEQYLNSWCKFLKRKYKDMEMVGKPHIVDRPYIESFEGLTLPKCTLGIKIEMKKVE